QFQRDFDALAWRSADREGASQQCRPLPHARQTKRHRLARYPFLAKAGAIVPDAQLDILIGRKQAKVYMNCPRMFGDILQALLSNSVDNLLSFPGKPGGDAHLEPNLTRTGPAEPRH